ncbi:MAG: S1 RNA-binding domain-containing protein [Oscillospiraceae bacterium]|nr:S1 RNA-binding domain-containing protein [Oscillospiraceae bacterium]
MQLEVGKIYEGKVTGITKFGAFVELEAGTTGMVHISEVANTFVNEIKDHLTEGQAVKVKVLNINEDGKISLSIKKAVEQAPKKDARRSGDYRNDVWEPKKTQQSELSFEDMLSKFKQSSEEKQCDLKRIMDNKRRSGSRRSSGK